MNNTSDAFGGVSKRFMSKLIALILEKISYRTIVVDDKTLRITGPENVMVKNKLDSQNAAIFVDASDNVGIGMNTPSVLLHVGGDLKVDGNFFIKGTTYSYTTSVEVTFATRTMNEGTSPSITVGQTGTYPLIDMYNNNNQVALFDYTGSLGIGTSLPLDKIDVNGFIRTSNGYKVGSIIIFDSSANAMFPGSLDISNNFFINTNKFSVYSNTGNTIIAGTLHIYDDFTISNNKFTIESSTGNTNILGTLNINNDKIILDAFSGQIDMSGSLIINNNKFSVNSNNGNVYIDGDIDLHNNLRINTNHFVVNNNGNTKILGTLDVSENVIFAKNQNAIVSINTYTGNIYTSGTLDISNNLNVNNNTFLSNDLTVYNNSYFLGSININNTLNLATKFIVYPNGDTLIAGSLDISKNLTINTNSFKVNALTGDTNINGYLDLSKNLTISNNGSDIRFFVNSLTGDVNIGKDCYVNNRIFVNNMNDVLIFQNNTSMINTTYGFNISGPVLCNSSGTFINNLKTFANMDICGNIYISGTTNIGSNTFIQGNTHVYGTTTLEQDLSLNKNINIGQNAYINNSTTIGDNLYVNNNLLYVSANKKQIGIKTTNPGQHHDLDISGNMRVINVMQTGKYSTNGYIIKMPTQNEVNSFKFNYYTNDERIFFNDNNKIIQLTSEKYTLGISIIEFDINYYLEYTPINYLTFSFDVTFISLINNAGSGLSISIFHQNKYINQWTPYANLGGYTIFIDIYNNLLKLYKNDIQVDEIILASNLITRLENYHNIKLHIVNNNNLFLYINNILLYSTTISVTTNYGSYFSIGGWTSSDTMTTKVKNIAMFIDINESTRKMQIFGDAFFKKTTIDGDLNCTGNLNIEGTISTTKPLLSLNTQIDVSSNILVNGNIAAYGNIVYMPNIGESKDGFEFTSYTIGNSYKYDMNSMIITLTESSVGTNQSIIEFNINKYLGICTLDKFIFSLNFSMYNPLAGGGLGMWLYFYNEQPYDNIYNGYQVIKNGYVLFIDTLNEDIFLYDNGTPVYLDISANISTLKDISENYHHLLLDVSHNGKIININLSIDNIPYMSIIHLMTRPVIGNYFGIGGITGGGSITQKVKNITLNGKFSNPQKKLAVFGDSILRGNMDIIGHTSAYDISLNGSMEINKSLVVSNNLLIVNNNLQKIGIKKNPEYDLDVSGSIHFTGELYQNGVLFNTTTQWKLINDTGYYTYRKVGFGMTTPYYSIDVSGSIHLTDSLYINNIQVLDSTGTIVSTNLIPALNATKITSGIFDTMRIPYLDASKIKTGILDITCIPNIDSSKISSGIISSDRIPNNIANGIIKVNNTNITTISGKVGIGLNNLTNVNASLDVSGNVYISGDINYNGNLYHNGNLLTMWNVDTSNNIYYLPNNIGIGLSNPQYKLHVSGSLRADTYHNLPIYGNSVIVPSGMSPTSISITNPYNSSNVIVTANCRSRYLSTKNANRFIVEIGDISTSQIEFLISTSDGSSWVSNENIIHYIIYKS